MPALVSGTLAPDFTLPTTDGKPVHLQTLLQSGPVIVAFFKVSCPVCQFAFPFYERVAQAHKDIGAQFLGICQNPAKEAAAFATEYGVTFPIAIDDAATHYAVSDAYGLTNVPTLFYIAPSGEIELTSVGWDKAELDAINSKLAASAGNHMPAIWRAGEDVPAFRAG